MPTITVDNYKEHIDGVDRLFVSEFLKDLNPTMAAERMGYAEDQAYPIACEFLAKDAVQYAMAEGLLLQREARKRIELLTKEDIGINPNYVLYRLKALADRSPKPEQQLKALELLGKALGIFKENVKVDVSDSPKSLFDPAERRRLLESVRGGLPV
jgi:hypothetical protein